MSERKHTPGPWEIRSRPDGSKGITGPYHFEPGQHPWTGGYLHVCDLANDLHHREANAHLIAAAPKLLEALEAAHAFIGDEYADAKSQALDGEHVSPEARPVWSKLCAALAKARGES